MSDEPKKYPADTPVTLGMLVELYEAEGNQSVANSWRKYIEPPKPEPKDGELWLVQTCNGRIEALFFHSGCWYYSVNKSKKPEIEAKTVTAPLKRVMLSEDSDE